MFVQPSPGVWRITLCVATFLKKGKQLKIKSWKYCYDHKELTIFVQL
jgi:hypothetical protein